MTTAYAHDIALDLWLRLGLIGLVLFALAFRRLLVGGVRVWRRHPDPRTAAPRAGTGGGVGGLIATAFLEPFLDEYRLATLFGVSLGMLRGTVTSMVRPGSFRSGARKRSAPDCNGSGDREPHHRRPLHGSRRRDGAERLPGVACGWRSEGTSSTCVSPRRLAGRGVPDVLPERHPSSGVRLRPVDAPRVTWCAWRRRCVSAARKKADVIYPNRFAEIVWAAAAGRLSGSPVVCHLHEIRHARPGSFPNKHVRRFIAVSDFLRQPVGGGRAQSGAHRRRAQRRVE